jgi:hypothetical protein
MFLQLMQRTSSFGPYGTRYSLAYTGTCLQKSEVLSTTNKKIAAPVPERK